MADEADVDAYVAALQGPDAEARAAAARALGELGDTSAGDALDTVLRTDPDVRVRAAAADALGTMRDYAWTESLADVLERDPDESVRRAAAAALALMGGLPR